MGDHWDFLFRVPLPVSLWIKSLFPLARRFFRLGVYHVAGLNDRTLVVMAYRRIYTYDLEKGAINTEVTPICGSRPLALCRMNDSLLYYGEYRCRSKGEGVRVMMSRDGGRGWEVAYTFNGIRHIHGMYQDPYTDSLWVTTGDANEESGIWVTRDLFENIQPVLFGNQQVRAVQLLFTRDHVYFGSDTNREENRIYRLSRKGHTLESLKKVRGPVFYGCCVGNDLFFSTVVEPNTADNYRYAEIWGAVQGDRWECVARFRKDRWPGKLFQYGQVLFPTGENDHALFFTPYATEGGIRTYKVNPREVLYHDGKTCCRV